MKKGFLLLGLAGILLWGVVMADEVYRWVDKNGTIVFSDSPPPQGSFKKQNVEDQIDKVTDQKKDVDKRTDINEAEKQEERIKLEIEYEKKARDIRNYDAMRRELDALKEKYLKKIDAVSESYRGRDWSGQIDARKEIRELKQQYEKEVRAIKEHYGYY